MLTWGSRRPHTPSTSHPFPLFYLRYTLLRAISAGAFQQPARLPPHNLPNLPSAYLGPIPLLRREPTCYHPALVLTGGALLGQPCKKPDRPRALEDGPSRSGHRAGNPRHHSGRSNIPGHRQRLRVGPGDRQRPRVGPGNRQRPGVGPALCRRGRARFRCTGAGASRHGTSDLQGIGWLSRTEATCI